MKILLIAAILVVFSLGVHGLVSGLTDPLTYEGREVFYSSDDYTVFKEAVIDSNADVEDIIVLSSNPPILVDFVVSVPRGIRFDYGSPNNSGNIAGVVVGALLMSASLGSLIWMTAAGAWTDD